MRYGINGGVTHLLTNSSSILTQDRPAVDLRSTQTVYHLGKLEKSGYP
jgi:hypothetical protein